MAKSRFSTELVRSCADLVVLTLLRDQPMYGYEILVSLTDRGVITSYSIHYTKLYDKLANFFVSSV